MNLPALKTDFESVVARIPSPPPLESTFESLDDDVDVIYKRYQRAMMVWRTELLNSLPEFERLFENAKDDQDAIKFLIESGMPQLIRAVEEALRNIQSKSEIPAEFQSRLNFVASISPPARGIARKIKKRWAAACSSQIKILDDFRDRLKLIEWDNDPDARGGEVYGAADDLIASLRS